eukprot:50831-Chlamydomonas_euryale.AAC.3
MTGLLTGGSRPPRQKSGCDGDSSAATGRQLGYRLEVACWGFMFALEPFEASPGWDGKRDLGGDTRLGRRHETWEGAQDLGVMRPWQKACSMFCMPGRTYGRRTLMGGAQVRPAPMSNSSSEVVCRRALLCWDWTDACGHPSLNGGGDVVFSGVAG